MKEQRGSCRVSLCQIDYPCLVCRLTLCSHLSCRVARVCEELRSLVGIPHVGLAEFWEECPCGPLWGPEERPVLTAQRNGPVFGFEGLWGSSSLRRGPEGRKLQAIRTKKTWIWPLYSWNASEYQWTDQNGKHCPEEKKPVWSSRGIYAKMIYVTPLFLLFTPFNWTPPDFVGLHDLNSFYQLFLVKSFRLEL